MPRTARIAIPGYPYHVTQRGNYRQNIFKDDSDRETYLSWIEKIGKDLVFKPKGRPKSRNK